MRKRIIGHGPGEGTAAESGWLDLENLAQVVSQNNSLCMSF
jgi:hypothetical protein